MLLSDFSVITPYGSNQSSCGYCKSKAGSHTYGMSAHFMTCKDYQALINRGWRRSGRYLYKPNLRDSCCPQYTIRMKANEFEASKHQRQVVNRFNTFIHDGDSNFEKDIASRQRAESLKSAEKKKDASDIPATDEGQSSVKKPPKPKKSKNVSTDLKTRIHSSEYLLAEDEGVEWKHRFKVKLEPSSCTDEKHALYSKYQQQVHHEDPSKCRVSGFKNFLVDSPLTATKQEDWTESDPGFGSFHQCYYLDDKLIAVSVIDILPECVSAVYFFYDPDYSALSLGKYSAQREIALVQTLGALPGYEDLKFYYMGFYIFTCHKMTYKGQFHPSFLLDPETYNWIEFKKCQEIMKSQRYTAFENPVESDPLFEAKIRTIVSCKKGMPASSGDDDIDDDEWDSIDEDDQDLADFVDKTVQDSDEEGSQGGTDRKKKKTENSASDKKSIERKQKEMDRIYKETTALPPPGCMNPKEIVDSDLYEVLALTENNAPRPIVVTKSYKNHKEVQKTVKEYYSFVGPKLANGMLLYIQ
ncbi:arginyl-tRNA---protein transferase [Entomortierella parvispora]|uniref:Arginyl-tRNA--protein transferase 1 n=1 Tax=Entomortierella parvispora TaxID=205924 RepID=A0A9P3HA58_9FUNG|nr:arginyl-tRNA---protein transferase [Entomortierella parvispora]